MSGYGWRDAVRYFAPPRCQPFLVGVFEAAVMTRAPAISLYFTGLARPRLAVQVADNVAGVIVVLAGGRRAWLAPFFAYAIAILLCCR